jgi:hypothetical protein
MAGVPPAGVGGRGAGVDVHIVEFVGAAEDAADNGRDERTDGDADAVARADQARGLFRSHELGRVLLGPRFVSRHVAF